MKKEEGRGRPCPAPPLQARQPLPRAVCDVRKTPTQVGSFPNAVGLAFVQRNVTLPQETKEADRRALRKTSHGAKLGLR